VNRGKNTPRAQVDYRSEANLICQTLLVALRCVVWLEHFNISLVWYGNQYEDQVLPTLALRNKTPSLRILDEPLTNKRAKVHKKYILIPIEPINRPPNIAKIQNIIKRAIRRSQHEALGHCF
jgi:hypothetical protein